MAMSTVALILAAGEQARWEMDRHPFYKQLLDVGGETIIGRAARQCHDRKIETAVITQHLPIQKALYGDVAKDVISVAFYKPAARRWTVEMLLSTYNLWQKRTIVLLGDVIYPRAVMDRIFAPQTQELKVFGNEYEIYALSFIGQEIYHPITRQGGVFFTDIFDSLNAAVFHAQCGTSPGGGKLRKFYQIYCDLDPDSDETEDEVLDRVGLQDYTQDVDARKDYIQLQNKVVKAGRLDDLREKKQ